MNKVQFVKPFYTGNVAQMVRKVFPVESPVSNKIYDLPNGNKGYINKAGCVHILSASRAKLMDVPVFCLDDMRISKKGELVTDYSLGIFNNIEDVKKKINEMMEV